MKKTLLILACLLATAAQAASYSSQTYIGRVKDAVWHADFRALDALWREAETDPGLDENGDNRIQHFIDESDLPEPEDAELPWFEEWQRVTAGWLKQHPGNPVAVFMAVNAQRSLAWHWRGKGYANSVTREGWEGFKRHTAEAQRLLMANRALLERSSLLYAPLLQAVKDQGNAEQALPLLREALQRHPRAHKLFFSALSATTPRWGGNEQLLEALIAFGVQHTQAQLGQEFYARLYTNAAAVHYQQNLFKGSRARWEPMRDGYRQMMQRYEGPRAANRYAMMACMAGDREAWREALRQLGSRRQQLDSTLWSLGGERMLRDCQRWAD